MAQRRAVGRTGRSGGPDGKERRDGREGAAGRRREGVNIYPAAAEDAEANKKSSVRLGFSYRNWPSSSTCCIKSHLAFCAAGRRF